MRQIAALLAMAGLAACDQPAEEETAPPVPVGPVVSGFDPVVSDLGIVVNAPGLAELREKVVTREDATCEGAEIGQICRIAPGNELYVFTAEADPAHPAAMFRGYVSDEDSGETSTQQRGWTAGDANAAQGFFARVTAAGIAPEPLPDTTAE